MTAKKRNTGIAVCIALVLAAGVVLMRGRPAEPVQLPPPSALPTGVSPDPPPPPATSDLARTTASASIPKFRPEIARSGDALISDAGIAKFTGRVSMDEVFPIMKAHVMPVIRKCYEDLLRDQPDTAGKLRLNFVIKAEGGKGRVESAEFADVTDQDRELESPLAKACIMNALLGVDMPSPEGGERAEVRFPMVFSFKPRDGGA